MMKKIILFAIIGTFLSCDCKQKEQKAEENTTTTTSTEDNSKFGRKNFAVVWKWTTSNIKEIEENSVQFSKEMNDLWKNGDIENVYYNTDSKIDKLEYFPNVTFFIKAKTIEEARSILSDLVFIKKGLITPVIYPVGTKWLARNEKSIAKKGLTKSYVAVWNTTRKIDPTKDHDLIMEQSNKLLKLNENGDIENVYWNLGKASGASTDKGITDFLFFINTNTEEEAKKLCDSLPFTKEKITSYTLIPVGVFWLGEFKK